MKRTDSPRREERAEVQPVRIWRNALSRQDCRAAAEAMARSTTVAGAVLRRSSDMIDPSMRRCSEHQLAADQSMPVITAMRTVAGEAIEGAGWRGAALDGPKFCSYSERDFFRAHRDRSDDHLDPAVVCSRRLSIVCLLNDATSHDGLPTFDGGALVIYVPQPDGTVAPESIRLEAGSIVTFRSDLLHEVRPVRAGVRYSAVAWLHDVDDNDDNEEQR
ncbi:2OG-Fe(II) oxygenase [Streptomyces sp. NPDC060035]|uniref:2OG-Fe(II) oxygenase n=1 Tax=Streptomyces sp. NPDC060035 TaxID=3347044 RepID=UPI0036C64833